MLVLYDRMCIAIAECVGVDEAKEIRDKSMALEVYYRQARNLDAERQAAEVRVRAERRVGELLKDLERTDPAERNPVTRLVSSPDGTIPAQSPYAAALEEHGISRQAAHTFQALASIPGPDFERALKAPETPTTKGVIRTALRGYVPEPALSIPDKSLWFWGRLCDFEAEGILNADADELLAPMTGPMRLDVFRLAPRIVELLKRCAP